MTKYWLVLALFGAMGCAVTPAETAGSTEGAVSDKTTSGTDGSGDATTSKGKGCDPGALPPPSAADPCAAELEAISEALKTATDPAQIQALKEKYAALSASCKPVNTDPCAAELAAIQSALDTAIKSGDTAAIIAFKEKYAAVSASCAPSANNDGCAAELAVIQASLDAAIKSGDTAAIIAFKEKYAAVSASCAPPTKELPPPDKK